MGPIQGHGAHNSPGALLAAFTVARRQVGEIALPLGNLQIQLLREEAILEPQQAVHHLIEIVLPFQEALFGFGSETLQREACFAEGKFELPDQIGLGEPALLDVVGEGIVALQLVMLAIALQQPRAFFIADGNT